MSDWSDPLQSVRSVRYSPAEAAAEGAVEAAAEGAVEAAAEGAVDGNPEATCVAWAVGEAVAVDPEQAATRMPTTTTAAPRDAMNFLNIPSSCGLGLGLRWAPIPRPPTKIHGLSMHRCVFM